MSVKFIIKIAETNKVCVLIERVCKNVMSLNKNNSKIFDDNEKQKTDVIRSWKNWWFDSINLIATISVGAA